MFSLILAATADFWKVWRPATCLPDDCFCEAIGDGFIRQPANTWSSLAFVLVALWIAARALRREDGSARSNSLGTIVVGEGGLAAAGEAGLAVAGEAGLAPTVVWLLVASLVVVGLGSAFYHASLTFAGQVLDVAGMYLLATFILLHRLGPKWGISTVVSVIGLVVVNTALMIAQVTTPSLRRVVFGTLLVAAVVVEWRSTRAGRAWLATGAALMAVAFLIWGVDRLRLVCAPDGVIQGHAIWHLLGALAAACLVKRYEAEGLGSTS